MSATEIRDSRVDRLESAGLSVRDRGPRLPPSSEFSDGLEIQQEVFLRCRPQRREFRLEQPDRRHSLDGGASLQSIRAVLGLTVKAFPICALQADAVGARQS